MRRNQVSERKRETQACEQLSALSLTIPSAQFALICQICLNSILGGLKEWAAGRSSKEEKSLLKKLTTTDPIRLETGSVEILWWMNLSLSDLKANAVTSLGFPISSQLQLRQGDLFHNNVQFTAKPCSNQRWWRWSGSCPQRSSLWESLDQIIWRPRPPRWRRCFRRMELLRERSGLLAASAPGACDEGGSSNPRRPNSCSKRFYCPTSEREKWTKNHRMC